MVHEEDERFKITFKSFWTRYQCIENKDMLLTLYLKFETWDNLVVPLISFKLSLKLWIFTITN